MGSRLRYFAIGMGFVMTACAALPPQQAPVASAGVSSAPARAVPTAAAAAPDPSAMPQDRNVLFWTQTQRDNAFRAMERFGPHGLIAHDPARVRRLNTGQPLDPVLVLPTGQRVTLADYVNRQRLAGIVIMHRGVIRSELYGLNFTPDARWTSFSVAKSFTSTLDARRRGDPRRGNRIDQRPGHALHPSAVGEWI